jgi:hypothetical protein
VRRAPRQVRIDVDRDRRQVRTCKQHREIRVGRVWREVVIASEICGRRAGAERVLDGAHHRDLVTCDRVRSGDVKEQLGAGRRRHDRNQPRDPFAIDADRGERVAQEFLSVKADPHRAEIGPALEHEIDELLDLAAAARLACDRQQHELRRAERDLRLLFGRDTLDAVEEPAQRADRVRVVEDLDHGRAARRPVPRRHRTATACRRKRIVGDRSRHGVADEQLGVVVHAWCAARRPPLRLLGPRLGRCLRRWLRELCGRPRSPLRRSFLRRFRLRWLGRLAGLLRPLAGLLRPLAGPFGPLGGRFCPRRLTHHRRSLLAEHAVVIFDDLAGDG